MDWGGHFSDDGRAFIQTQVNSPRPWRNQLWNEGFVATCTQQGQGEALRQDEHGHRRELHQGRMAFLIDQDSGERWTVNGIPLPDPDEGYEAEHGLGYSELRRHRRGIASAWRLSVPQQDACEHWRVQLRNDSLRPRRLRLIVAAKVMIGGWFAAATSGRFVPELAMVQAQDVIRNGPNFAHYTQGALERVFLCADRNPSGYDTRSSAFIGPYGSWQDPAAIAGGGCQDSHCEFESACLALQFDLDLAAGATTTIRFLLGHYQDEDDVATLRQRLFADDLPPLATTPPSGESNTGDPDFDRFCRHWLPHQLRFNATWARVYYNGFRDLCQDVQAYAAIDPQWSLAKFRQVLSFQYASGYAPRAWIGGGVVEQDYADSPVWIAPSALAIAAELGHCRWLDEKLPFVDGEPCSIYEHLRRSLEYLWQDRGRHQLSKIHKGDWNDLLNAAGWHGQGESVWLSQALIVSLEDFATLAEAHGNTADATLARQRAEEMRAAVRQHAWRDGCFIRAISDDGIVLGSVDSPEGIFLTSQAWGLLSACVTGAEAETLRRNICERLETPQGLKTIERGFTGYRPEVGCLSTVRPGSNVNAGLYLHANAFAVAAAAQAGDSATAWRQLRKILPYTPERGLITGEPFVLNNGYYGPAAGYRTGHSDTGWITGTCGWVSRIISTQLFGLMPTMAGLRLRPCLPAAWGDCTITRHFRDCCYVVRYHQGGQDSAQKTTTITVDGVPLDDDLLPLEPGRTLHVTVHVGD